MKRLFRVDFYPQDWLIDAAKLTPEEAGIYITIVCLIYSNRGVIDNDPAWIGGFCKASNRLIRSVIDRLVEKNFIQLSGKKITQKRCELELNKKRNHLEESVSGGRKSAELRRQSKENNGLHSTPVESSLATTSPSPIAIAIETNKPKGLFTGKAPEKLRTKKQLPDDWAPHENHRAECQRLSLDCDDIAFGLNGFKNYHQSKGNRMLDWDKAFFTWIGNAAKWGKTVTTEKKTSLEWALG